MNYSGFYGDNNPLFIINDSTLITIKIDFKSLQSDMTDILNNVNRSNKNYYAIKGSRATNDLINMAKFIDEQAKSYVKAYNYYNTDTSKNIKKDNLLKMKEMSESLRTKLLTYYDSISHPMVNFFMLFLIQKYYIFSSNEIKILAEKTLKKNPNNPYLKSIQNEMEENIKKENHIKELIEKEKNKSTTH